MPVLAGYPNTVTSPLHNTLDYIVVAQGTSKPQGTISHLLPLPKHLSYNAHSVHTFHWPILCTLTCRLKLQPVRESDKRRERPK